MHLAPPDRSNLIGQETGRAHLSYSSLSTFINCAKRYEFEKVRRLEPVSKAKALSMGKAFTIALEHGNPMAGAQTLARETFSQSDEDGVLTDMAVVNAAASAYLSHYPPFTGVREYGYRIQLRSPYTGAGSRTFDLLGYADGVIEHADHIELIEDKFVGRLDASMVRRVKLDRQVGLEAYALWRVTGKPVTKIQYRFTKKPSIKQKQTESVRDYTERVAADYLARPEFYLQQETTYRDADDLLQLEGELWDWAEQLRNSKSRGFYTRNTTSCTQYGGCPFIDLCSLGESALPLYRKRQSTIEERAAA